MNKLTRSVLLPVSLLFISVLSISAASEEKINRQLDAQPRGKLVVDVDFGKIDVSAGAGDKVTIDAFRSVDFGDEAKACSEAAQNINLRVRRYSQPHSLRQDQSPAPLPRGAGDPPGQKPC